MTKKELGLWVVEQAVILTTHTGSAFRNLQDEVGHVVDALKKAEELLK